MNIKDMKVIDVIEKALVANLTVKDENVKGLLLKLMETCQENIGKFCLNSNNADAAEQMRLFHQDMSLVIQKLKDENIDIKSFLETSVDDLKEDAIFNKALAGGGINV